MLRKPRKKISPATARTRSKPAAKKAPRKRSSGPKKGPARRASLYAGAHYSRLTAEWVFGACSTDQEIKQNLRLLRLRARDLQRNSPTVRWYLTLLKANVIGKQSPRLQCETRIGLSPDGNLDKQINDHLEVMFARWGRAVSTDGKLNLVRMLWKIVQALAVDGEVFVRRIVGYPHNEFGFALQLLEPDLCDEQLNTHPTAGAPTDVRLGVEVDEWERPLAYYFWNGYPDEGRAQERERIPASEILHLYDHDRCSQTRGVTWMKAILIALKMLDGFVEAELVASRAAAQKVAWLKYSDGSDFSPPDPDDPPTQLEGTPGEIGMLPPGMELAQWDPQHPSTAFEQFVKGAKRDIASGLGTFYNSLANDAQGISWSSMRSFLQIERDVWQMVQTLVCETLLPWIFEGWLQTSTLTGAVELPTRDWRRYAAHNWRPRGWVWVDPENQSKAAETQLRDGLASPQDILAEQGKDLEDVLEKRAEFRRLCRQYGEDPEKIMAAWGAQGSTLSPTVSDNDPDEDDEDPKDPADAVDTTETEDVEAKEDETGDEAE